MLLDSGQVLMCVMLLLLHKLFCQEFEMSSRQCAHIFVYLLPLTTYVANNKREHINSISLDHKIFAPLRDSNVFM